MASCLSHSVIATAQLIAYCRPYKHPSLITGSLIYLWRRHGSNLNQDEAVSKLFSWGVPAPTEATLVPD